MGIIPSFSFHLDPYSAVTFSPSFQELEDRHKFTASTETTHTHTADSRLFLSIRFFVLSHSLSFYALLPLSTFLCCFHIFFALCFFLSFFRLLYLLCLLSLSLGFSLTLSLSHYCINHSRTADALQEPSVKSHGGKSMDINCR